MVVVDIMLGIGVYDVPSLAAAFIGYVLCSLKAFLGAKLGAMGTKQAFYIYKTFVRRTFHRKFSLYVSRLLQ